jgi:hypothetical protein
VFGFPVAQIRDCVSFDAEKAVITVQDKR